jgi:PAS domain S-box-containing protein
MTRFGGVARDVTEQFATQQKASEIEAFRNLLYNAVPAMIFYLDQEQRYTSYNETFMHWYGIDAAEAIGKTVREFVGEATYEKIRLKLEQALAGERHRFEIPAPTKIGEGKWLDIVYIPHKMDDGAVRGLIVHATDITQSKLSEIALRESEARFRTMAEGTDILISVSDNTHNAMYFNAAWTRLTNRLTKDLLQYGWADLVHNDDRDKTLNTYLEAAARHAPFSNEFRIRAGEKEYRWLLIQASPRFTTDGSFAGYIGAGIDVTDRKKQEQQIKESELALQMAIDIAELGTFVVTLHDYIGRFTPRIQKWFDLQDTEMSMDIIISKIHPEDQQHVLQALAQTKILEAESHHDFTYRVPDSGTGADRHLRSIGKTFFDGAGKPYEIRGIIQDVTPQIKYQQKIELSEASLQQKVLERTTELESLNQELKRSNHYLEEFAHAASHDLKEPIRKIQFFTNALISQLSDRLTERETSILGRIQNSSTRMGMLIDDLLLYSHISQKPLEKDEVDLSQKLEKVLEDLELEIEEKGAVINIGHLPVVHGYKRQLQQLFQNLISNAIKYTKPGTPAHIEVTSSYEENSGKAYNCISVADQGIGFPQEYAEKIFKMFTRLHGKAEYSGTGVGLAIVKKVVDNHDGYIEVKSAEGAGATFKICLPVL